MLIWKGKTVGIYCRLILCQESWQKFCHYYYLNNRTYYCHNYVLNGQPCRLLQVAYFDNSLLVVLLLDIHIELSADIPMVLHIGR